MAFALTIGNRNLARTKNAFDEYLDALPHQFEKAMQKAAMYIKRESQRLTPVDTGRLRRSARVTKVGKGFDVVVGVSYNTDYAVYVHERLDVFHPRGQAKFLSTVIQNQRNEITGIVLQSLREQQAKAASRWKR